MDMAQAGHNITLNMLEVNAEAVWGLYTKPIQYAVILIILFQQFWIMLPLDLDGIPRYYF